MYIPSGRRGAVDSLPLTFKLRGCAAAGMCYIPQTWQPDVALPAAPAQAAGAIELFGNGAASTAADELLPLDDAFAVDARFDRADELVVSFRIAPDYYLYRHSFAIDVAGGVTVDAVEWPQGVAHTDESFGDVEVFFDYVEARVQLVRTNPAALDVAVTVAFQGCKEGTLCYPPAERTLERTLPAVSEFAAASGDLDLGSAGAASTAAAGSGGGSSVNRMVSEQDRLAELVLGGSWGAFLLTFYGAGLLLAFTPCVLPMVPILSGIIAGQGAHVSPLRGFALSLSYVLGMAVTYTAAGAIAALAGEQVQAIFQKPWIITLFAGVFVVLALGMFGVFQLQMPAAIQTRMATLANRQSAGTFAGTAVIGALSALIVTTCVAPPLIAALTVIGQSGDVVRGSTALFTLSMGMGTPLLIAGASAGTLLPKVGPWMNTVKGAFGVLMLGMAVWMLDRVLPGTVTLVLWALLVFMSGVFLGAFEPLPANPPPARRIAKGAGVLACLYGALLLIGATLGGDDPLKPLAQFSTGALGRESGRSELEWRDVANVAQLEAALAEARAAARPVMIDFTADWCTVCKELEKYTFSEPTVVAALEPFMLLRADGSAYDDDDAALLKYFEAYGYPTVAFYDASGRRQDGFELASFVPADEFLPHVRRLAAL
jgi:thiol:disulfide interchange protein DsbD